MKFGWKEKNIIKLYLPKRDKYENKKEKDEEIEQSIVIFFTWRYLKKDKEIINSCENSNITVNNDKPNDNGENIFIPDQEGKDNDI